MQKPVIVCLDLEGVLVPEIWINVAIKTGIEALKITTREMPDYDKLMRERLVLLEKHKLGLKDIQAVIELDSALAASTLRLANSAYFGGSTVDTLEQAVDWEVNSACWTTLVSWRWVQIIAGHYFAWRTKRLYLRYEVRREMERQA